MGIKSLLSIPLAKYVQWKTKQWSSKPFETQEKVFDYLINRAANTAFGKDHHFSEIKTYADFKARVPIGDYESLKPYIQRIKDGEENVLWPAKPIYFAKTSGTTSGAKYIPITRESIPFHINGARDALLLYIAHSGRSAFVDKKMIFLSGSPELDHSSSIPTGRLSGIVNHWVPAYLRANQLPSYEINCIDDWEAKLDKIVDETIDADMALISGIPPWVQMYFDRVSGRSGKPIAEVFHSFSLFVYGGVNFEPYRAKLEQSIGKKIDSVELYPASEGFIALQDKYDDEGLLLLLDSGMFYEFIKADEYFNSNPERISIRDVELGVNYAIILNTNAGLWGYSIGDTVKFVSKTPYKIVVTGRVSHFLSAFGEHVIAEEVEKAMKQACSEYPEVKITEFTVSPQVTPAEGLPYHEWFIEFEQQPNNMAAFAASLDIAMQKQNIYYLDLISGNILRPLIVTPLARNGFIEYMKTQGKLGGQNKLPRLSNNRMIADALGQFSEK